MEKMSKFNENFIKNYNEDSNIGDILEEDIEYSKRIANLHNDLPFSPKIMKIKKYHNLACNLYDKKKYVAQIRILEEILNHGLILKKYKV